MFRPNDRESLNETVKYRTPDGVIETEFKLYSGSTRSKK